MVERIISACLNRTEKAVLGIAELCRLPTGGRTRRDANFTSDEHRFGLEAKSCSRLEALLENANRSDGTLVFGPASEALARRLMPFGPAFSVQRLLPRTPGYVNDWINRFRIRTLNIVAEPTDNWAVRAGCMMLELLARQGHHPLLPMRTGCKVVVDVKGVHAVRLWRTPRGWTWRGGQIGWKPVRRWDWICGRQSWVQRGWFTELLPEKIREIVSQDEIFLDCEMLKLVVRLGQPAIDLASAGRWAVLKMLAEPAVFLDVPLRRRIIRKLVRLRQRDLIGVFGFPKTESAVRALAKVPATVDTWRLVLLRDMLNHPELAEILRHLPRINDSVIHMLSDPAIRLLLTRSCVIELSRMDDLPAVFNLEGFHMEMQRTGIQPRAGSVRSLQDLWDLHRALQSAPDVFRGPRPAAPLQLPGLIEPLTTEGQLMEEGYRMHHCVGTYCEEVQAKLCLIFRLLPDARLGNERATLMLRRDPSGERWCIAQMSGEANQAVSGITQLLVEKWLEHAEAEPACSPAELRDRIVAELANQFAECTAA